ncbi:ABC transporter substrate-binding protein [Paenibacillus gansuensis]|uniref:ABC transporter substrate-binding protein n=1 Tax=Paenibacillus gansuensis TaxID=306542 RepID=A0ABW5P8P5_9BACL
MKKQMKKAGFILTAAVLSLSIALGGCSSNETPAASVNNSKAEPAELKPVELSWHYLAWEDPKDLAAVNEKINEITTKKINATVKLYPLTWDNFKQKTNIMAAAGDTYDLVFTSNWINEFDQAVSKGALRKLDDLWQYMPNVKKSIPDEIWKATSVKGSNYAVINKQIFANQYGIGIIEPYVKEYNLELDQITSYEQILPVFEKIHADHKDVKLRGIGFDTLGFAPAFFGKFEAIGDTQLPGWLNAEGKVINQYDTPELRKVAQYNASLVQKGYIDPRSKLPGQDFTEDEKANKYPIDNVELIKPDMVTNGALAKDGKTKRVFNLITKPKIFSNSLTAAMTGISTTSKNPERAAMLIELVNTDKELYNLITFGIEGKHYTKAGDNLITKIADSGYNTNTDFVFGNVFNGFYTDPGQVGSWDATEKLNNEAEYSELLGFNFVSEPVKTEIAAVKSVMDEYGNVFAGWFPEKYEEFLAKLKNAGVDKIIAEKQRQVDEWKSSL